MNYTSGTTGRPKGVRRALPDGRSRRRRRDVRRAAVPVRVQPSDDNVHIVGSPLYHTAVLVFSGAVDPHRAHRRADGQVDARAACSSLIDKYRVTNTPHGADAVRCACSRLPDDVRTQYDVSSLRYMVHAAAPCPPDVKRQMLEWWGPVIDEYYAATEGGGTYVSAPRSGSSTPAPSGKPWPISEIAILDDDGNERSAGRDRHRVHAHAHGQRSSTTRTRRRPTRASDGQVLHRRRRRLPRRGRLAVPLRSQDRHDHLRWGEHLPRRDRERADHAPEGRRRRRVRHPARRLG